MSYGIEVYNSQNKKIFTSEKATLQIIDYGQVNLDQGENGKKIITFPSTKKKPKVWIEEAGYHYWLYERRGSLLLKPTIGELSKNSNDEYVAFTVAISSVDGRNVQISGGIKPPWTINYIVFV